MGHFDLTLLELKVTNKMKDNTYKMLLTLSELFSYWEAGQAFSHERKMSKYTSAIESLADKFPNVEPVPPFTLIQGSRICAC